MATIKEKYFLASVLSLGIGAVLNIAFKNTIFLALGLFGQLLFIIKAYRSK